MKNFIIVISLLFLNKNSSAVSFNNDSLKNKYELNDPRNPNCPCHRYQKLADEEFAITLKQTQLQKNNVIVSNPQIHTSFANASGAGSSGNIIKSKHFKNLIFFHHKNKSYKIFNFNKSPRGKKRHQVHKNKNISSCFGWR